jgi:cytidine deaminase
MTPPTADQLTLWEQARAARNHAYAPYSGFRVGAALRTHDGAVILGGNIENASYGLTVCAERVAMQWAVSEGVREFVEIAVAGNDPAPTVSPCGACRQVLSEFAPGLIVIFREGGEVVARPLVELLPAMFDGGSLPSPA